MVGKASSVAIGHRFIVCDRSVRWKDGKLHQTANACHTHSPQGLDKSKNWNEIKNEVYTDKFVAKVINNFKCSNLN